MTESQNLLETWLAEERDIIAKLEAGPGPGVARPEQVSGKTGLEIMQAMLRGDCLLYTSPSPRD